MVETDSERIPRRLMRGLASEYDKEKFLTLRYPAVLPQGSSLFMISIISGLVKIWWSPFILSSFDFIGFKK